MTTPTTSRRTRALAAGALLAALALTGCSGTSDDDAAAGPESQEPTAEPSNQPSTGSTPLVVRYSDEHKTVITVAPDQLAALTGVTVDGGGARAVDDAVAALADAGTWSSSPETADHVDVVTEAAERESDRLRGILTGASHGEDVGLRLVVKHDRHADVAHFSGHHDDGDQENDQENDQDED